MTQEVLEKATVPFFTTKEMGKGTGLGLSMVYTTVKAHNGQLVIESEPGKGTRVKLFFPVTVTRDLGPERAVQARLKASDTALKVLLVDDDDLILRSTRMLVEVLGHTVTSTLNGEDALALIEDGFRPDVVILDMNMPGLGGRGTLPRLRALCPSVPVLLATGRADQEALALIAAHPHVALLSKPFSIQDLHGHLLKVGG
jgi:CheY-like chemotaxis protein